MQKPAECAWAEVGGLSPENGDVDRVVVVDNLESYAGPTTSVQRVVHRCVRFNMRVGDVAVPNRESVVEGRFLRCGSGMYSHAIVGSVEPFVLVSSTGDMVWSTTWKPEQLEFLCQASDGIKAIVKTRLRTTRENCRE